MKKTIYIYIYTHTHIYMYIYTYIYVKLSHFTIYQKLTQHWKSAKLQ